MQELSIFIDESGDKSTHARYFLLTAVFHEQNKEIVDKIMQYERSLAMANLPNIPFHSEPLLNGRRDYAGLGLPQRKKLLSSFNVLAQRLPIAYQTFLYRRSEQADAKKLFAQLKRDIKAFLIENLEYFQSFDNVKLYYDNGQEAVKRALHEAMDDVFSSQVMIRKRTTMSEYRLAQVADYFCTIELAAAKYAAKENGGTYDKFFGGIGSFKKNWLKQARRKMMKRASHG